MRFTLFLVLLGLLGLTWWALRPAPDTGQADRAPAEEVIDYFVEELDLTTFSAEGEPLRHLQAAGLLHHRHSGETLLSRPRFTLFEDGEPLWKINAEEGTLAEDHSRLMLEGQVNIRRLPGAEKPPLDMVTRNLLVKPGEEYAETAEAVTITSDDNWIEAVGMRAWLRPPGHIKFLSRTRAHYVAR